MADLDRMAPGAFRKLSPGERVLADRMFGRSLDAARPWIFALPVWDRAFVAGASLIVWPARAALQDFSAAHPEVQAVFVHELTHVWQAQNGVNLILAKLRAGDRAQSYAYDLSDNGDFRTLNIEQQAMVVQDAYLASQGRPAPHGIEVYSRILATWPLGDRQNPRKV